MDKLVTIQTNVPICPECNGTLRFNKIAQKYICISCYSGFKIEGQGKTEREFLCKKEELNVYSPSKNKR